MQLNIFSTIWHLPMVWDFIIPLSIILLFCAYLFWEGKYGKGVKKRFRIRFGRATPPVPLDDSHHQS